MKLQIRFIEIFSK